MTDRSLSWQLRIEDAARRLPAGHFHSRWFEVTQRAIDLYEQAVEDDDPAHLDPKWAIEHTPFGGTIAPGLWGLSMFVAGLNDTGALKPVDQTLGVTYGLNYGYDKVRFVRPIRSGTLVRCRFMVRGLERKADDKAILRLEAALEGESAEVLIVADWLLAYLSP